jgi:cobalt-zinc-cadmium efflux system outer membrane protein
MNARKTGSSFATLALLATAGGCASLDPKPDIDRAATTVYERSGFVAAWDRPWSAPLEAWDGRSPLTVDQAVLAALTSNREIRTEVELIGAGRADLVQAGLLPNPVLSVFLGFPVDPVEGYSQAGASVVQSFVALWLRPGRIRAAEARLNESVLSLSDRALRLVADVKASHARLVYGQRGLALTRQNIEMVEKSIDALEGRVRAGEGTQLDVNRARQQLLLLRAELTLRERDLAKERRELLRLLGFAAAGDGWSAADGVDDAQAAPDLDLPNTFSEATVIELAKTQRLDVAAARAVVEASSTDLSIEERSRIRDLGLGLSFEQTEEKGRFLGPELEIALPIFDMNQAQIAKAGSLARAALITYDAVAQRAVTEARTAFVEADASARLARTYLHDVMALAEQNLTLAQASLNAGEADVTVLLEAQRNVVEAREALNGLEEQAALARIELEYAVGGRLAPPAEGPGGTP